MPSPDLGGLSLERPWWLVGCLLALLLICPSPSPATAQELSPTTSTASPSSTSLLDTLDKAIDSSMTTNKKLLAYEEALRLERAERKQDNIDRMREIESWQMISEGLSNQVTTQQGYLLDFDKLLSTTSVEESEKQKARLAALDSIQQGVKKLELTNQFLSLGLVGAGLAIVATIIIEEVRHR